MSKVVKAKTSDISLTTATKMMPAPHQSFFEVPAELHDDSIDKPLCEYDYCKAIERVEALCAHHVPVTVISKEPTVGATQIKRLRLRLQRRSHGRTVSGDSFKYSKRISMIAEDSQAVDSSGAPSAREGSHHPHADSSNADKGATRIKQRFVIRSRRLRHIRTRSRDSYDASKRIEMLGKDVQAVDSSEVPSVIKEPRAPSLLDEQDYTKIGQQGREGMMIDTQHRSDFVHTSIMVGHPVGLVPRLIDTTYENVDTTASVDIGNVALSYHSPISPAETLRLVGNAAPEIAVGHHECLQYVNEPSTVPCRKDKQSSAKYGKVLHQHRSLGEFLHAAKRTLKHKLSGNLSVTTR